MIWLFVSASKGDSEGFAMRQFCFRLTDGTNSRYKFVEARDYSEAEIKIDQWCKGKRWRWPIFDYE